MIWCVSTCSSSNFDFRIITGLSKFYSLPPSTDQALNIRFPDRPSLPSVCIPGCYHGIAYVWSLPSDSLIYAWHSDGYLQRYQLFKRDLNTKRSRVLPVTLPCSAALVHWIKSMESLQPSEWIEIKTVVLLICLCSIWAPCIFTALQYSFICIVSKIPLSNTTTLASLVTSYSSPCCFHSLSVVNLCP